MRRTLSIHQPVFETLEPRLLLDAGVLDQGPDTSSLDETDTGRVVIYVTIPSQKDGDTFGGGGVYRSFDRGDTWEWAMGEGINLGIGQHPWGESDIDQYWYLDQAEHEPDTIHVTNRGTGYSPPYHYTVYRSTDAGDHWDDVFFNDPRFPENNTENGWQTWEYSRGFGGPPTTFFVNPTDSARMLYNNYGQLFLTTDSGVSWRQVYSHYADGQPPPQYREAGRWESIGLEVTTNWSYDFDPHDPNRTYICYTDIGFARSEDHGQTWRHEFKDIDWANTTYQVAFDPDVPGKIFGAFSNQHDIPHWLSITGPRYGGGVAISSDYGDTWTSLAAVAADAAMAESAHTGLPDAPVTTIVLDPTSPVNSRTLYAGVYGYGVYKSTDGGSSWTQKSTGITPMENRQVWQVQLTGDGTLYCTVAGRRAGNGVDYNVTGGFYKSTNGGDSWTSIGPGGMFRPVDFAIHPTDPDIIYVAAMDGLGHYGGVYKTTDGGTNWTLLRPDFDTSVLSWIEGFGIALNPTNPDILYFTTVTHGMFISVDAGATWTEAGVGRSPAFKTLHRITWDPQDPGTVYVNTFGGGVWKGPDPAFASGEWEPLGLGGGGAMYYGAASPHDADLMFVSCDMGGMYRTEDGGGSWTMLDWREKQHSGWTVFHPTDPDVIFALPFMGRGWQVWKSTDRGLTWSVVKSADAPWMSDNVLSMVIDSANPRLMLLGGENGLYRTGPAVAADAAMAESANGGDVWVTVANAPQGIIDMHIDQTSPVGERVIFAATEDAVWRSDDNGLHWQQKTSGLPWTGIRSFSGGSDGIPYVVSVTINDGLDHRSGITSLAFRFSEDVSGSLEVGDLSLIDDATGQPVDLAALSGDDFTYDVHTNTGRWSFPHDLLPSGTYTAAFAATDVTDRTGNRLDGNRNGLGGDDYSFGFFCLHGDLNGDGKVDGVDLAFWQINYDPLALNANAPDMGDFNHDGSIDGGDLAVWQQNYDPVGMVGEPSTGPLAAVADSAADGSVAPTSVGQTYYVATDGSNGSDGSTDNPWRTISYALARVQGGDTILVGDGVYNGSRGTYRSFDDWVTVKAENPYRAKLTNIVDDRGGAAFYIYTPGSAKIIVEGFIISNKHPTYTSDVREGSCLIHIQDAEDVIFRNNIIFGNNAPGTYNELFKVNRGGDPYYPKNILITGNVFYDRPNAPGTDMIDSVRPGELDITDNIFCGVNAPNAQSFITLKREVLADTLGITPRSPRYKIQRNVFLNYSGSEGQAFIQLGEDADAQYMITDALVENNLLIGNSDDWIRAPFQLKGPKNVTIRANTIIGDLPGRAYGLRIGTEGANPQVQDIFIYNNIWADPTGTMGQYWGGNRFIETYGDVAVSTIELDGNLYWNNGQALPDHEVPRPADDAHRLVANPGLDYNYSTLVLPMWDDNAQQFLSGSTTIREEFERLVTTYGAIPSDSPAVDAADAANMPADDILGNPRDGNPDLGAFEYQVVVGDANGDGHVDGADLSIWQQHYDPLGVNPGNGPETGDFNEDGKVDGGDLALWQEHYDPLGTSMAASDVPREDVTLYPATSTPSRGWLSSGPTVLEGNVLDVLAAVAPADILAL